MSRLKTRIACAIAACLAAAAARADLTFRVEGGVGRSDNIARTADDEIEENILSIATEAAWHERRRRLDADVNLDLTYYNYLEDTYDAEVVGTADASLVFGIIPDRFTWLVEDTFGQVQSDPFAPATPGNRDNLNYFTTGPDLILNVGAANSLRLLGRYSLMNSGDSVLDAERTAAGVAWFRETSRSSEVGLQVLTERMEFDNDPTGAYDRSTAIASYQLDAPRTQLDFEAGYSWLKRDAAGSDTEGGVVYEVRLVRDFTAASSLGITAGRETTHAGDALRESLDGGGAGAVAPHIAPSAEPFENRSYGIEWRFQKRRTGLSLGVSRDEARYEIQSEYDNTRTSYDVTLNRRFTAAFGATLEVGLTREEFINSPIGTVDEQHAGILLDWSLARTYGLRFTYDYLDRSADGTLTDSRENRVFLSINWYPRGPVVHEGRTSEGTRRGMGTQPGSAGGE